MNASFIGIWSLHSTRRSLRWHSLSPGCKITTTYHHAPSSTVTASLLSKLSVEKRLPTSSTKCYYQQSPHFLDTTSPGDCSFRQRSLQHPWKYEAVHQAAAENKSNRNTTADLVSLSPSIPARTSSIPQSLILHHNMHARRRSTPAKLPTKTSLTFQHLAHIRCETRDHCRKLTAYHNVIDPSSDPLSEM